MRTALRRVSRCALVLLVASAAALAQDPQADRGRPSSRGEMRASVASGPRQPVAVVPLAAAADVILGRPTSSSVVLSLLRYDRDGEVTVSCGLREDGPAARTAALSLKKDQPWELSLDKLEPHRRYRYRVRDTGSGQKLAAGSFETSRAPGEMFVFSLTADSHLDLNTDTTLYQRALANAGADAPDFHIDLGDTFMTGKHQSRDNAARQYLAQRIYFAQAGQSMPLYLVLGNHDGEDSRSLRDGADSLAVWSNTMRKRYFPNPLPDVFYTGNTQADAVAGQLQDYYAWTWGDGLFVVLDPYWHGAKHRGDERWDLSLGDAQYHWLERTLAASKARYKFVFIHQLVGGRDRQGRGGVEAAIYGEWGGRNADGSEGFGAHRPGWDLPIHQLLVRHGVNAVFHGHDHLYAAQTLDGIVYQEVPQPGHPGQGVPRFASEYGYLSGTLRGAAGHLRVTVAADGVTVDYVLARSDAQGNNRQVAHSYTIAAPR